MLRSGEVRQTARLDMVVPVVSYSQYAACEKHTIFI